MTLTRRPLFRSLSAAAIGVLVITSCGGDDGGSGGGSAADFCGVARAFDESNDVFDTVEESSTNDLRDGMRQARAAIDQLAKAAPSEIRDDVNLLKGAFGSLIELLEENDYDFFATVMDPANADKLAALDSEEFNQAADRVNAYVKDRCGIDLDSSGSSTDDTTGAGGEMPSDDSDGTIPGMGDLGNMGDTLAALYADLFGIDQERAKCLADKLMAAGVGDVTDPSEAMSGMMEFFGECNINPAEIGG